MKTILKITLIIIGVATLSAACNKRNEATSAHFKIRQLKQLGRDAEMNVKQALAQLKQAKTDNEQTYCLTCMQNHIQPVIKEMDDFLAHPDKPNYLRQASLGIATVTVDALEKTPAYQNLKQERDKLNVINQKLEQKNQALKQQQNPVSYEVRKQTTWAYISGVFDGAWATFAIGTLITIILLVAI